MPQRLVVLERKVLGRRLGKKSNGLNTISATNRPRCGASRVFSGTPAAKGRLRVLPVLEMLFREHALEEQDRKACSAGRRISSMRPYCRSARSRPDVTPASRRTARWRRTRGCHDLVHAGRQLRRGVRDRAPQDERLSHPRVDHVAVGLAVTSENRLPAQDRRPVIEVVLDVAAAVRALQACAASSLGSAAWN